MTTMMITFITLITLVTIAYTIKEFKPFTPETTEALEKMPEAIETNNEMKECHIDIPSFDSWCEEHQDIYQTSENKYWEDEVDIISRKLAYDQQNSRQFMQMLETAEELDFKLHKISLFAETSEAEETETKTEEEEEEEEIFHEWVEDYTEPVYDDDNDDEVAEEDPYTEDERKCYWIERSLEEQITKAFGRNIAQNIFDIGIYRVCKNANDLKWIMQIKGIGEKRARKLSAMIAENNGQFLAKYAPCEEFVKVESDDLPF